MSPDPDWTRTFFDETALDVWQLSRSEELTAAEVDYLEGVLACGAGARLLDLACGNGRHAVPLAVRGFEMTGVDIAEGNRARLEARAEAAGVAVRLIVGDMATVDLGGGFDGAYLWGNSFGYMPPAATADWLGTMAQTLEPGARLVIDTAMVAESLLPDLGRRTWVPIDDETRVLLEARYAPRESRLDTIHTTIRGDRVVGESTSHVWVLTSGELIRIAEAAGLVALDLHGTLEGDRFELGDERLIAIFGRG